MEAKLRSEGPLYHPFFSHIYDEQTLLSTLSGWSEKTELVRQPNCHQKCWQCMFSANRGWTETLYSVMLQLYVYLGSAINVIT